MPLLGLVYCAILRILVTVAYLGFRKGGAKFSLATSAQGGQPSFPIFIQCKNFWPKGGHGPMASPKYASGHLSVTIPFQILLPERVRARILCPAVGRGRARLPIDDPRRRQYSGLYTAMSRGPRRFRMVDIR